MDILRTIELHDLWLKKDPAGERANFENANLRSMDLSGVCLRWAILTNCDLSYAKLSHADLRDATMRGANLTEAILRSANLSHANLQNAVLTEAKFHGATLTGANLSGVSANNSIFASATLIDVEFDNADIQRANFVDATLRGTRFSESCLLSANFHIADLQNVEMINTDLRYADLSFANLTGVDLTSAVLSSVNLDGCSSVQDFVKEAKEDIFRVLACAPEEAEVVLRALEEGRIDGSSYTGSCACLIGTIANAKGLDITEVPYQDLDEPRGQRIERNSESPAETFFEDILPGQTPNNSIKCALVAGWVKEFIRDHMKTG